MTVDELDYFIAEEKAKRANAAKPVMDATPIEEGGPAGGAQQDPGPEK
jgi:hypothetical protein